MLKRDSVKKASLTVNVFPRIATCTTKMASEIMTGKIVVSVSLPPR